VAARIASKPGAGIFGEFERLCDQLFDEHLISPWRTHKRAAQPYRHALMLDHGAHYEIRIATAAADARSIEIEVSERRLSVRIPGPIGVAESVFDFASPVDCDAVSARLSEGTLRIVLPKKPGRRVEIK
jgi:HSP20 family molecular chaperone IbpA